MYFTVLVFPFFVMVSSLVGIWIEIKWLKKEMSGALHAGAQDSMESSVRRTAVKVCGSYLALYLPAFLLVTFHPQPPNTVS